MLRFHLLLSEAITGLLWKEFEQWLVSENVLTNIYDHVIALSGSLKEKDFQSTNQSHQDIMNCLKDLIHLWLEFEESLGVTARYWNMKLEMVQIVLHYVLWCLAGTH